MAKVLAKFPGTSYVRTPESIVHTADAATERGTWTRRWRTREGPIELRGRYSATWKREIGGNGTPSWSLEREVTNE
jgi:hypothetical protein